MDVYITGGTGFVGSALAQQLADNHSVPVGDLDPSTSAIPLPDSVKRDTIDVTEPDTLEFTGFDAVIHLVALSPLWKPPDGTSHHSVHVEGTENVVKEAIASGVDHMTHMSALGADPAGSTAYIRAKGAAEEFVDAASIDAAIIRPSVIVGANDEFLSPLIKLTRYIPVLPLPLGGSTMFQPLVIDDLADMIVHACEHHREGSFTLGGPDVLSLHDLASLAFKANDRSPRTLSIPEWLVAAGAWIGEHMSLLPFGNDQRNALVMDNTLGETVNDCRDLGFDVSDLTSVERYIERAMESP